MVVKGIFSLELVEAESKQAFKEHTKDGATYTEVEPDAEYFVKVSVHDDRENTDTKGRKYLVKGSIDGKYMAFHKILRTSNEFTMLGSWARRKDGVSTTKALKFQKPSYLITQAAPVNTSEPPKMGKVLVRVYEAIANGKRLKEDFASIGIKAAKISVCTTAEKISKKTVLRSGQGSQEVSKVQSRYGRNYKQGVLLETLELNYCTALGLILVGILPEPPLWEKHRLQFPASKAVANDPRLASIQPTITVQKTENSQGQVMSQKEMEEYDLTFLSDSDEEGEKTGNGDEEAAGITTNQAANGNQKGTESLDHRNTAIVASSVAQEGNHEEIDDDNDDGSSSEVSVYEVEKEDRVGLEP